MHTTSRSARRSAATAILLLLVGVAACSNGGTPAPASTPGGVAPSSGPASPVSTAPVASTSPGPGATPAPSTTAPRASTAPTATLSAPATAPVQPPTPGSTAETVAPRREVTKKAVKLDKPSAARSGVVVQITEVKAIKAKAQLPGEVAGPAVALTVVVKNSSGKPVDLSAVVVNVLDSDQAPGTEMTAAPAQPLSGQLASGRSRTGVYVFTVGTSRRNPISVTVTLAGEAPVLLFTGDAR